MYEHDSGLAILHLGDAARLFKTGGLVSGQRLKLADLYQAPQIREQLSRSLGAGYRVTDWTIQHVNLFRAIKIERRVMFIILLLIVAVAAFNIVSTLVMLVTDKRSDVAILRTFGTGTAQGDGNFYYSGHADRAYRNIYRRHLGCNNRCKCRNPGPLAGGTLCNRVLSIKRICNH